MKLIRCVALVLALVMLLAVVGCNQATSARNAVERFEAAMNKNNYRAAFAYVSGYDNFGFSDGCEGIIDAVASSLNIEILSESGSTTDAQITVNITTVDLRQVYRSAAKSVIPTYYSQAVSGNSISNKEISERLTTEVARLAHDEYAQTVTTKTTLNLQTDSNGKWLIQLDPVTYYAITGYLDEANNLITTGTITDAIAVQTTPATTTTAAPVTPSDEKAEDKQ